MNNSDIQTLTNKIFESVKDEIVYCTNLEYFET